MCAWSPKPALAHFRQQSVFRPQTDGFAQTDGRVDFNKQEENVRLVGGHVQRQI